MDNLIVLLPWLLGLTLFSALWAAEWLSARRQQKRMERRLGRFASYSLAHPNIPKPYQRKVR